MHLLALFIFAIAAFLKADQSEKENYFSNPSICITEEFAQQLKEMTLDMRWNFGEDSHFRFVSGNDQIYFEIYLGLLPDLYNDFLIRMKDQFVEKEIENKQYLVFSYRIQNDGTEEINVPQKCEKKEHPNEYSYIVGERRIFENANPHHISEEELHAIIKNNDILFYTGAGLSLSSGVPAMHELNELLELEEGEQFLFCLEKAINNPREFTSKILVFHQACLYSPPTEAHLALKELALFKNIRMITENLDCLHESSGIYPYRINAKQLREEIGEKTLAPFKYIICVGLSYDDKGFLGWYKQHNPQGKIIAIDLQKPSYLGDEDFLLIGNLQEILPPIQEIITQ